VVVPPGLGQPERRESVLAERAMSEFVIRLADEFGLVHPHARDPDIGTGSLPFAAGGNPNRLRSVVAGSGGASFPVERDHANRLTKSRRLGELTIDHGWGEVAKGARLRQTVRLTPTDTNDVLGVGPGRPGWRR
jgi:hypothetical protein